MPEHALARAAGAAVLALTLASTVAACGTGDDARAGSSAVSATKHNDADVAFASDMLQHHAQALSMVDLTRGRPLDPEVRALAERIQEAQAPEIETFAGWLRDWDEKIPETVRDHAHADHDMGSMGSDSEMPGMMSSKEMKELESAPDRQFQDRWLRMMVDHHAGAVDMAEAETNKGRYKPALELAHRISTSQRKQIDTMKSLVD